MDKQKTTQAMIAEKAGCTSQTISHILRGGWRIYSIDLLAKVVEAADALEYKHDCLTLMRQVVLSHQRMPIIIKPKREVSAIAIAAKANVSPSMVYKIRKGDIHGVAKETVKRVVLVARKLGYAFDPEVMKKLTTFVFGEKTNQKPDA